MKNQEVIKKVEDEFSADIYLHNGPIDHPFDDVLRAKCACNRAHDNAILVLVTYGGSASSAYRMARAFQKCYKKVIVVVPTQCKSAGTLIAIGAHEIYMSPFAELGPLDVQLGKRDEIFEQESGLAVSGALDALQEKSFQLLEHVLLTLRARSGFQISTPSALETAEKLAIGLYAPIYGQLDPVRIGEIARSLLIASDYGERLNQYATNLKDGALVRLVHGYPSHDFVIDFEEARTLFNRISLLTPSLEQLMVMLGQSVQHVAMDERTIQVRCLSQEFSAVAEEVDGKQEGEANVSQSQSGPDKRAGEGEGTKAIEPTPTQEVEFAAPTNGK
ncbi:MAG: hypothetical protein WBP29_11260 [Candidatus Zixiibacteriota bacterium]